MLRARRTSPTQPIDSVSHSPRFRCRAKYRSDSSKRRSCSSGPTNTSPGEEPTTPIPNNSGHASPDTSVNQLPIDLERNAMTTKALALDVDGHRITGISNETGADDLPLIVALPGGSYTSAYFDVPGHSLLETGRVERLRGDRARPSRLRRQRPASERRGDLRPQCRTARRRDRAALGDTRRRTSGRRRDRALDGRRDRRSTSPPAARRGRCSASQYPAFTTPRRRS